MVTQSEVLKYLEDHPGYHNPNEICNGIGLCGRPRRSVVSEIGVRCRQLEKKGDVELRVGAERHNMFRAVRTNNVPSVAKGSEEEGVA